MISLEDIKGSTVFFVIEWFEKFWSLEMECMLFHWEWLGEVEEWAVLDSPGCMMTGLTIKVVAFHQEKQDPQWVFRPTSFDSQDLFPVFIWQVNIVRSKDCLRELEELTELLDPDLIIMVSEIITEWVVWWLLKMHLQRLWLHLYSLNSFTLSLKTTQCGRNPLPWVPGKPLSWEDFIQDRLDFPAVFTNHVWCSLSTGQPVRHVDLVIVLFQELDI